MEKFKFLSDKKAADREQEVSQYWKEIDLLDKSIKTREGAKSFIFMKDLRQQTASQDCTI